MANPYKRGEMWMCPHAVNCERENCETALGETSGGRRSTGKEGHDTCRLQWRLASRRSLQPAACGSSLATASKRGRRPKSRPIPSGQGCWPWPGAHPQRRLRPARRRQLRTSWPCWGSPFPIVHPSRAPGQKVLHSELRNKQGCRARGKISRTVAPPREPTPAFFARWCSPEIRVAAEPRGMGHMLSGSNPMASAKAEMKTNVLIAS
eukprot:scaffold10503_cov121-Isochrysis_galbana.AAC.2